LASAIFDSPSPLTRPIRISLRSKMTLPAYDIFKKDATGAMIWVEAVENLESARMRVKELSRGSNTEYAIFDQHTKQIVFKPR